jgi:hypothetical protein
MSNFIFLLLVQAPTVQHASQTKHLLDIWSQNLCRQYRNHESLLAFGLVRLRTLLSGGLRRNFVLSSHVADVLSMNMDREDL